MSAIKAVGNCPSVCVYAVVFVTLLLCVCCLLCYGCTPRALPLPLLPLTRRVLASICCICLTTLIAFVCAVTNSVCFVCAQLISPMASSRLTTTPRFLRRRYQVIFCHSLHGPSPVCVLSFSYFFGQPPGIGKIVQSAFCPRWLAILF